VTSAPTLLSTARVFVRRASALDIPALAALRTAWTVEDTDVADDPSFEDRFADWHLAEESRRLSWLAMVDDVPVGMLNLVTVARMPRPGQDNIRWGYISNVFVLAAYRNHGVGRRMLDAAVDFARRERYVRLTLHPTARSVPFYRRAGFGPKPELLSLDLSGEH
jgi:GNAT superfamily N-acetyltransferase